MCKVYKKVVNSCDNLYSTSLDVRFTKVCDNSCSFCIEKKGLSSLSERPNVSKMIESTINSGKKVVLLLGGEPLLYISDVLEYYHGVKSSIEEFYITTSGPKTILANKDIFIELMDNITCLNFSMQHYESEKNNSILNASSNHSRLEILKFLTDLGYSNKVRVSINLVRGYIDTKEELLKFIEVMYDLGIRYIKINELQHSSDTYVSFEKIMGLKLPSPYSSGCQTNFDSSYFNSVYRDLKIILKRSCFLVEDSNFASINDLKKLDDLNKGKWFRPKSEFLVLYENGVLSSGWLEYGDENRLKTIY